MYRRILCNSCSCVKKCQQFYWLTESYIRVHFDILIVLSMKFGVSQYKDCEKFLRTFFIYSWLSWWLQIAWQNRTSPWDILQETQSSRWRWEMPISLLHEERLVWKSSQPSWVCMCGLENQWICTWSSTPHIVSICELLYKYICEVCVIIGTCFYVCLSVSTTKERSLKFKIKALLLFAFCNIALECRDSGINVVSQFWCHSSNDGRDLPW